MGIWEIVGVALFVVGFVCLALRLVGIVDWPWWKALLPLLLAVIKQLAAMVTAGLTDYFTYLQTLLDRLSGGP